MNVCMQEQLPGEICCDKPRHRHCHPLVPSCQAALHPPKARSIPEAGWEREGSRRVDP